LQKWGEANHSSTTGDNVDKSTVVEREQTYFDDARVEQLRSLDESDHSAEAAVN
jgi:hypothetical protein